MSLSPSAMTSQLSIKKPTLRCELTVASVKPPWWRCVVDSEAAQGIKARAKTFTELAKHKVRRLLELTEEQPSVEETSPALMAPSVDEKDYSYVRVLQCACTRDKGKLVTNWWFQREGFVLDMFKKICITACPWRCWFSFTTLTVSYMVFQEV